MKIKSKYLVHKFPNGKFAVCKIVNEVDNEQLAIREVLALTTGKLLEKELEDSYIQKIKATLSQ